MISYKFLQIMRDYAGIAGLYGLCGASQIMRFRIRASYHKPCIIESVIKSRHWAVHKPTESLLFNLYFTEIKKPAFEEIIIPQCVGRAIVAPDVRIIPSKQCSEKKTEFSFSAVVHLKSSAGKGCDRQNYEASDLYKL